MKTLNVKIKITTMKKNEAKKTKLLMLCYQRREILTAALMTMMQVFWK